MPEEGLDGWLGQLSDEENIDEICDALMSASEFETDENPEIERAFISKLKECEAKLTKYPPTAPKPRKRSRRRVPCRSTRRLRRARRESHLPHGLKERGGWCRGTSCSCGVCRRGVTYPNSTPSE